MNIDTWSEQNQNPAEMYFAEASLAQIDRWRRYATWFGVEATVVSSHRSKSCILPVVRYQLGGAWLMARDNFHNLMVSVEAPRHIRWLPSVLNTSRDVHAVYCEGFNEEFVFPCWDKSPDKFTIELFTPGQLLDVMGAVLDAGRPATVST